MYANVEQFSCLLAIPKIMNYNYVSETNLPHSLCSGWSTSSELLCSLDSRHGWIIVVDYNISFPYYVDGPKPLPESAHRKNAQVSPPFSCCLPSSLIRSPPGALGGSRKGSSDTPSDNPPSHLPHPITTPHHSLHSNDIPSLHTAMVARTADVLPRRAPHPWGGHRPCPRCS
jgi:hypothetical protein